MRDLKSFDSQRTWQIGDVFIVSSSLSSSSGTKPLPPHDGHRRSSSVPFSTTPSPLQSGQVFMRASCTCYHTPLMGARPWAAGCKWQCYSLVLLRFTPKSGLHCRNPDFIESLGAQSAKGSPFLSSELQHCRRPVGLSR